MDNAELASVDEDFYSKLRELLKEKNGEALGGKDLLAIKEYENMKKIAKVLVEKRMEKLVLAALRGKDELGGLAREEREFLVKLSKVMRENAGKMHGLLKEKAMEAADGNIKKVKFLKNISPYRGLDDRVYGPFESGAEAELPFEEAQWLLKERMAELV